MSVTVDANILVYASNQADAAHPAARELLEQLAAGPDLVHLLWPAVMGYLRIATHHAILPSPLAPAEAIANVESLGARSHIRISGEGDRFWAAYRDSAERHARGNHVPDAHLVALMREHGIATIYSRDRDLRRFDGIRVIDPVGR